MSDVPFDREQAHRWFAVHLNNRAWDLVEQESHTDESIAEMLHTAHAACWHWQQIGTPLNSLRAYCLLATAYAVAECGDLADRFAAHARVLSDSGIDGLTPFDRASAFGCSAGAASLNDEIEQVEMWQQRTAEVAAELPDEERALIERLYG